MELKNGQKKNLYKVKLKEVSFALCTAFNSMMHHLYCFFIMFTSSLMVLIVFFSLF